MAFTDVLESTAWNNPMIKHIRKVLAAVTIIMGSAAVAMMLFGSNHDGGSLFGNATRAIRNITHMISGVDPVIAGIVVGVLLLTGLAFWVRGR